MPGYIQIYGEVMTHPNVGKGGQAMWIEPHLVNSFLILQEADAGVDKDHWVSQC